MKVIGEIFNNRYRVMEELERGHCISSYVASDEVYGVEVEMDVIQLEVCFLPHLSSRLKEVLDSAVGIASPCVASLFEWREEEIGRAHV